MFFFFYVDALLQSCFDSMFLCFRVSNRIPSNSRATTWRESRGTRAHMTAISTVEFMNSLGTLHFLNQT